MYTSNHQNKIKVFLINQKTSWLTLPWRDIYLRVLMIKKRIFISSKKNDLKSVHKLQNHLINCNEAKVILINEIIHKICLYYSNYKQTYVKTKISQLDRFNILHSIFSKKIHFNKTLNTITKEVKQSLFYYSIKPVFEARLFKQLYQRYNNNELQNLNINLSQNNLLIKNIVKRLTSCNYINNILREWLYDMNCFNLLSKYNLKYKKYFTNQNNHKNMNIFLSSASLFKLIFFIIKYDIYWCNFIYHKTSYSYLVNSNISAFYNMKIGQCNKNQLEFDVFFDKPNSNTLFILFNINYVIAAKQKICNKIFSLLEQRLNNVSKENLISLRQNYNHIHNMNIDFNLRKKANINLHYFKNSQIIKKINRRENQQIYLYDLNKYYIVLS